MSPLGPEFKKPAHPQPLRIGWLEGDGLERLDDAVLLPWAGGSEGGRLSANIGDQSAHFDDLTRPDVPA